MIIRLQDGLPYVTASLLYHGQQLTLENVLLDTGSAGTIFATERVSTISLQYEPQDSIHRIRGVGGAEFVFTKRIDHLFLGELHAHDFEIEVGAMDYGFAIDGIIGTDFLVQVRAVIDLGRMQLYSAPQADS